MSEDYQTRRAAAAEWEEAVIGPLQAARDHAHWRAVHRRDRVAGYAEAALEALLRLAYGHKGALARGEAGDA